MTASLKIWRVSRSPYAASNAAREFVMICMRAPLPRSTCIFSAISRSGTFAASSAM